MLHVHSDRLSSEATGLMAVLASCVKCLGEEGSGN